MPVKSGHKQRERTAGDLDLARTLLRLGADPDIRDQRFGSTPLGRARRFGHERLIELLEPISTPEAPGEEDAPEEI